MYPIFSYVYLIKYIEFKKSDWMCRIVRTSTCQRRSQGRKIAMNDRTTGRRKMSIFCFVTKTGSEIFLRRISTRKHEGRYSTIHLKSRFEGNRILFLHTVRYLVAILPSSGYLKKNYKNNKIQNMEYTRFLYNLHEFELFNTVFQQLPNKLYIPYFWRTITFQV